MTMRTILTHALVTAAVAAAAVPARAQMAAPQPELVKPATSTGQAPANLPLATVLAPGDKDRSVQFILDASTKDKVGTFAIGWRTGHGNTQLSFSGPLNANQQTEPVSLTGLAPGATAKVEFSRLNWKAPSAGEIESAAKVCDQAKVPLNQCSYKQLLAANRPEAKAVGDYLHVHARPWIAGGSFSVTRRTFDFLTRDTLDDDSADKTGVTATVRVGVFSQTLGFLIGSYTYRKDFRAAGAEVDICQPISGTAALRCEPGVVGGPVASDKSLLTAEVRRLFVAGGGVNPQVAYDFRNDRWLVDVPLYFVPGKGNVTGGVKFAWRSDTKAVAAVIFIGTALELF